MHLPATRVFVWTGFVWQLCTSSFWTLFFVRMIVDLELTPLELVLLGTAKETTILLAEIPTGVVADLVSRRLSVITGFLVCGSAIIGAGIAPGFVLLALTQVVWAFGSTFRSGAETAWYTDEVRSVDLVDVVLPRRARFESAGSIIGVLATATLASIVGLSISLAVVGSILIAWGILLVFRMPETGFIRPDVSMRAGFGGQLTAGFQASGRPALRILLVATTLTGFASEAVDRLDIARLDQIGLPATVDVALLIGAVVVTQMIGSIAILIVFARRLNGRRLVNALVAVHVMAGIGVALLARADLLVVALVGLVAQGMVRDVARTVTVAWTNHFTHSSNRATVHSFVGQAMSFGEIGGGIVLGVIAQTAGIAFALTVSAGVYFIAAGAATVGRRSWSAPARSRH